MATLLPLCAGTQRQKSSLAIIDQPKTANNFFAVGIGTGVVRCVRILKENWEQSFNLLHYFPRPSSEINFILKTPIQQDIREPTEC